MVEFSLLCQDRTGCSGLVDENVITLKAESEGCEQERGRKGEKEGAPGAERCVQKRCCWRITLSAGL